MAHNTEYPLGDHFAQFIDRQIESGRYDSVGEVIRAGLRLLEEREAKLGSLRSALIEGEESGEFQEFEIERFLASVREPDNR